MGKVIPPKSTPAATTTHDRIRALIASGKEADAESAMRDQGDKYYADGSSDLSDAEYDALDERFFLAFGRHVKTGHRLASTTRTDRQTGHELEWPLLAAWISNKPTEEAKFTDWYQRCAKVVPAGSRALVGSPKYDGQSVTISYDRHGNVQRALTRGDEDGRGMDVTRLFAGEKHFADGFDAEERFGIKFEVAMTWADLDRLNEDIGDGNYKNPRNTVAGLVSSDDSRSRRDYIVLVPLDMDWEGAPLGRTERLDQLYGMMEGFTGNGQKETPWDFEVLGTLDEALAYYEHMSLSRNDHPLMLDGVVFEFGYNEAVEAFGGREQDAAYACAFKFPALTGSTRAISMDFDLGTTGRVTPVVNFEPIKLLGNTYSRTSLANFTRFDDLRLSPGTPLRFELRGDVIGWLDRAGPDPEGAVPFSEPDDVTYTYNKEGKRVFGYVDPPLAGRVQRLLEKCGVKGVKESTIDKLVSAGLIQALRDALRLTVGRVSKVPGLGQQSAVNICAAIDAKCQQGLSDWEILGGIGIASIGRTISRAVLKRVTLEDLIGYSDQWDEEKGFFPEHAISVLSEVDGIGPERAMTILHGVRHFREDLLAIITMSKVIVSSRPATGPAPARAEVTYKVVVTGDLKHWSTRDEFKDAIEALGHKMSGSVSAKTDFLVTNEKSNTTKRQKADSLGVRVITEDEAMSLLGVTAPDRGPRASNSSTTKEVSLDNL